jgi:hypothetical protein
MHVLHVVGIDFASEGVINYYFPAWTGPFFTLAGVLLLFGFLHLARGIGRVHGALAKQLLVKSAADA